MSKILLCGGEGFIGKHFQRIARERGLTDIHVYDLVNGDDIRDKFKLDRLFDKERFDVVINMAAWAGVASGEEFYDEYFTTNCIGLMNLIRVSEKYKVKKFIHLSSSSANKALSVYGVTKLAGIHLVKNSSLNYSLVKPFTVIGENGRKEMVMLKWREQILRGEPVTFYGDGTTYRGYTYVGDFCDGVIKAIDGPKGEYNLGGDQKVTLEELWQIFKELYPQAERKMLPLPVYDEPGELADTSESLRILGWKHTTNIPNKIREIIQ